MNNMPISTPKPLKPRAQELLGAMVFAGEIAPQLERDYLIKGWLDRGTVSLLYGPSNVGKTFLALDIAQHVASGEKWAGCLVRKASVLYIGIEGGVGIRNRIAALKTPQFWFLGDGVSMRQGSSDPDALSEVIAHLETTHLETTHDRFGLIVIDTLARAMGQADENASRDMASFLNAIERLRLRTGSHVLIIHHTGKDVGQGARGHSSLLAHVDTAIELTSQQGGPIHAELKKQRDGRRGQVFGYCLEEVDLGNDSDGDPVTTCVVMPDAPAKAGRADLTGMARDAMHVLDDMLKRRGQDRSETNPSYPTGLCVSSDEWLDKCVEQSVSGSTKLEDRRRSIKRIVTELERQCHVTIIDGFVWSVTE